MSFLICGHESVVEKVGQYLHHYSELAQIGDLKNISLWKPTFQTPQAIRFENKYYVADLFMTLMPLHQSQLEITNYEGIVLVHSQTTKEIEESVFKLGSEATEAELGLRLLVSVQDDPNAAMNEQNLAWAIDHGFEYIEIFEDRLLESHTERDKIGLPRLREALECNMWSTMQRKQSNITSSKIDSKDSFAAPIEEGSTQKEIADTADQVEVQSTSIENDDDISDLLISSLQKSKTSNEDSGLADEDSDDDMKMFEDFANMMAQARNLREKAVSGKLSDAERRANAAAFAMKLSAMMNMDDDSETDS